VSLISFLCGCVSFASTAALIYSGSNIRRGVTLSIIIMMIGTLIMPSTKSLGYFVASSALACVGAGIQPLLLTSAIFSGVERGKSIPAFTAALSLSLIVGPIYLALLSHLAKVSLLTSLLGLIPIMALGLLAYIHAQVDGPIRPVGEVSFHRILDVLRNRGYQLGVILEVTFTVPFAAFTTYGAILADARGASGLTAELMLSVFFTASFAARAIMSYLEGKASPILVFLLTALGLPAAALSTTLFQVVVSFVLLGLAHGLAYPLSVGYVAESVGRENLAWANTVLSGVSAGVLFLTLPILGYLAQSGGLPAVFLAPEPLVVALALAFWFFKTRGKVLTSSPP